MNLIRAKNNFKNLYHSLVKKDYRYTTETKLKSEWYGNNYGGFFVHPKSINKDSIVYSIGIGEDISFDEKVVELHNSKVFMFDPTPKSIEWVKNRKLDEKFIFHPFGIDQESKEVDFYLPTNENFVSGSIQTHKNIDLKKAIKVPMKSLKDIANELGHSKIEILKMDIEGSEYDVLPSILESGVSIHQILIEFHARFFENGYAKSESAVNLLKNYGYRIFAISDSFEEISFIKIH